MPQNLNHKFEQLIAQAGFSGTYERERLYRLLYLTIAESANTIDSSDFVNVKYPSTQARDLLENKFEINNEQNKNK